MADVRTLEDRARAADIRRWAEEHGLTVPDRGRIPKGVVAAYETANRGRLVDDEPDWDRAAADLTGTETAQASEPEPDDKDQDEPDSLPPPSSLDEARARAGSRQPRRPAWAERQGTGSPRPRGQVKVPVSTARDIEGKLALLLSVPVGAWEMADPYCGGAAAQAMPETVKAAVPLICQSPAAVAFFTRGTTFMLWLGLANALRPVGQAVYQHHLSPEARKAQEQKAAAAGRQALPDFDVSAYTTDVTGHVPQPRPA